MKKSFLAVLCFLSIYCVSAQTTYTVGHITTVVTDTMLHDSTYCRSSCTFDYHITIDTSYTGDSVMVVDTFSGSLLGMYYNSTGISPWSFATSSSFGLTYYANDGGSLAGPYAQFYGSILKVVRGTDTIHAIVSRDSLLVTNPCSYGLVSGNVYIDNNSNCIYDAGDVPMGYFDFEIMEYLSSPPATLLINFGTSSPYSCYYVQKSWMTSYTVSLPAYYAFIFPNSPCSVAPYTFTTLPQTAVDFPLQCTNNMDVRCYPLSPASVRLHTPFYIQPYVSNTGCDTASGTLKLIKDSRVIYNALLSSHPADTVHGDTLIWVYSGLSNVTTSGGPYWTSFLADIYLTPDTTVIVGDTLCFRTYTQIPSTDINPSNNDQSLCLPVVYSYDPNEKEVSPKGTGPQGLIPVGTDTLTYTVHFQNTGSATAYDIHIIDTLDSHINPNSLKILGTSHNMLPEWLAPGVIQFKFANIMLPDSTSNEPASHGQVQFSVVLNPGLSPGTHIKNTGYIYFDLNPPVVTNTTLNTIAAPNKINAIAKGLKIKVYPNPATTEITIEASEQVTAIAISNLVGQTIYTQTCNAKNIEVNIANLPSGIYFVKVNGTVVRKFVKE
ncbi:MAG: T9SS type A sorting domain-containing protein [Chitinophagales bacterium]